MQVSYIIEPNSKAPLKSGFYAKKTEKEKPESAVKIDKKAGVWRVFIDGQPRAIGSEEAILRGYPYGMVGRVIDFAEYMQILTKNTQEKTLDG